MDILRIRMSAPSVPTFGPTMLPLEGDVLLDRYRVVRQIGAGGMGVVYEGVHLRTERRVAIKCLNPECALDPEALRRFEWEAKGATNIGNAHIVDVIDMDALPNGVHFIVLEYLDGADLGRELKTRGAFQVHRAVSVVLQMCEALALAHDKGIIHRDLKPANILLIERDGNSDYVKILDFGIAKFKHDLEAFTGTGRMLGTPTYMAPEQMMNAKGVDRRADLYSLGCILFAMIHGDPPFLADNLYELISKVQREVRPDLESLRPEVPAELSAIVSRLIALNPAERFEDCVSLRTALLPYGSRPAADSGPRFDVTKPSLPSAVRTPRRARAWAVAAGVVLAAAVVGLASMIRRAPEQQRPAFPEPHRPSNTALVATPAPFMRESTHPIIPATTHDAPPPSSPTGPGHAIRPRPRVEPPRAPPSDLTVPRVTSAPVALAPPVAAAPTVAAPPPTLPSNGEDPLDPPRPNLNSYDRP